MSCTLTFYIARHGKTLLNTLDKVQGWCDSPLTDEGIEVARFLGAGLSDISFDSAYSSDLNRTRWTAEIVLKEKGQGSMPVTEMFGFRETCFGGYESDFNKKMWGDASLFLQYTSAEDMYKDIFGRKITSGDVLDVIAKLDKMGLAETFARVENRSQEALRQIAEKESEENKDKNILIISHGMCIICLLYNLGGKELLTSHLENAAVCKVVWHDGKFSVKSMGDMSYVENGRKIKSKL